MKEMIWNKEEATKRLAIMYHSTKHAMEKDAFEAVTAPDRSLRDHLFEEACEKSNILTGILMSAGALGIDKNEIIDMEIDKEESSAFLEELTDDVKKKVREEMKENIPSDLKDLLSDLFG